jgi:hypothetical protein
MLYLFFKKIKLNYLASAGLIFILAGFAKNEGLLFLFAAFLTLGAFLFLEKRMHIKFDKKKMMLILLIGSLIFAAFLARVVFFTDHEARLVRGIYLDRIPNVAFIFSAKMLFSGNWHLAWIALVLALMLFTINKKTVAQACLSLNIILDVSLFAAYYLTTDTGAYSWLFDGTVLCRNLLQFTPAVMLFAALQIISILSNNTLKEQ